MRFGRSQFLFACSATAVIHSTSIAATAVMTFSGQTTPSSAPAVYTEGGIKLVAQAPAYITPHYSFGSGNPSPGYAVGVSDSFWLTFTAINGTKFSFGSIDVSIPADIDLNTPVTFTATKANGGTVTQTVDYYANNVFKTIAPTPGTFNDVTSVTVGVPANHGGSTFDNVTLDMTITPTMYFGGGGNDLSSPGNYSTSPSGSTPTSLPPDAKTDLFFASINATSGSLNATLSTDQIFNSLTFGTGANTTLSTTIGGSGKLTLGATVNNYAAGTGIVMVAGSAANTINVNTIIESSQSWTNNAANPLTVNGAITLGNKSLKVAGTGPINLSGLILITNASGSFIKTESGTLRLKWSTAGAALLTGLGSLDVQGGTVVFDYTGTASPATTIKAQLKAGYMAGFSGTRLRSTTATATRGIGFKDDGTGAFTVMATLYGDADLDGGVSINDFNALAGNFGKAGGQAWVDGDFDYDGGVSINDFNLLAGNFGQTIGSFGGARPDLSGLLAFAVAHDDLAAFERATGVPESAGLTVLAAGAALGRRRSISCRRN